MLLARHLRRSPGSPSANRVARGSYVMHMGVQEEFRRTSWGRRSLNGKVVRVRPARDHLKTAPTIHMCNSRSC